MKHLTTVLFLIASLLFSMDPVNAAPPVFNGNLVAGGKPWFDVTFYGAKGDGSTDDHAAIQAANTAASAACGTLYFPPSASNYIYNSATPIVIADCETVYSLGATVAGGAAATGDFIEYAAGGHPNISFLPNINSFQGAALHFLPGASQSTVYFPSFSSDGIGIEMESDASHNSLDNTVYGFGISSDTAGIEIMAASASDVQQGNVFNVNFLDCDKYSVEFTTSSGTPISPTGVNINLFNLPAVDGCNVAGSVGIYGVTNFTIAPNYFTVGSFWGGFATAETQYNGGVSDVGPVKRIIQEDQQFKGRRLTSLGGDLLATGNISSVGFGEAGGNSMAGFGWNGNGQGEATIYSSFTNPGVAADFYYYNGSAYVKAASIGTDGTYTPGTSGAYYGAASMKSTGPILGIYNQSGGATTATTGPGFWLANNITNGQSETDFVSTFEGTSAQIAFSWYGFQSTTQTHLADLYRNGNLVAIGTVTGAHNACSATSGVPCETTVSCSISATTGCNASTAVPANSNCTVTANASDTTTGIESFKVSLSSTTLTVTSAVTSQTSTSAANVHCL